MTSADANHAYKTEFPKDKIGFSTVSETSRKSCLCQICCNIARKCEALKTFLSQDSFKDIEKPPCDKNILMNATLCDYTGKAHKSSCLRRECKECGVHHLQTVFESVNRKSIQDDCKVTWYKSTNFEEFLADLKEGMTDYPSHKFSV